MYEVAKNVRNDYFRKQYRIPKLQSLDTVSYEVEDIVNIETTTIKNLEITDLKQKITLLSPLKQKILVLKMIRIFLDVQ